VRAALAVEKSNFLEKQQEREREREREREKTKD